MIFLLHRYLRENINFWWYYSITDMGSLYRGLQVISEAKSTRKLSTTRWKNSVEEKNTIPCWYLMSEIMSLERGGKKEGDKKLCGVDSLEIAIFPTEVDSGVAICQDVLVRGLIFHNIFHNLQYLTLHDYAWWCHEGWLQSDDQTNHLCRLHHYDVF